MEECVPPETHPLSLPSTLGCSLSDAGVPHEMAYCEVEMRTGQANDALHDLRLSIARKSFLYRTQVRNNAPAQSYVTRSYGEIHNSQTSIEQAAKTYRLARSALEKLGVPTSILLKYQLLNKEDLRANTAVADSNAPGQRYDSLSWIWHTSVTARSPACLDECMLEPLSPWCCLTFNSSLSCQLASGESSPRSLVRGEGFAPIGALMDRNILRTPGRAMGIPCSKLVKPWPCLLCSSASTRLGTPRTAGITFYAINVIIELPALSYLFGFICTILVASLNSIHTSRPPTSPTSLSDATSDRSLLTTGAHSLRDSANVYWQVA